MSKQTAILTLSILFALTLVFGFFVFKARIDYEFEKFFPAENEEVTYFNEFRDNFGTDNDFIMLAIENENGIFDSLFLNRIKFLTRDIKKLPYVADVAGPTTLKQMQIEPLSGKAIPKRLIQSFSNDKLKKDSIKIYADPMLIPVFFSKNGKVINLLISHDQKLSKLKCDFLVDSITSLLDDSPFDEYHLMGRAVAQGYYVNLMKNELIKFTLISIIIVSIFLFLTYRNLWSVIIPLIIVLVSAIWTIGIMTIFDKPLDIMLVVLPTLLFIVGISDVIHLYTKFLFLKREGMGKEEAIRKTMKDIGLATFLTSLTTAIGFATLYFIRIPIIREFGMISAFGVMVTFSITFLAFSAFLSLSPEKNFSTTIQTDFWKNKLRRAYLFSLRKGKWVFLAVLIFTGISLVGLSRIHQRNKLLEDLPANSPLLTEIDFFDQYLVGTRPFELGIKLKDSTNSFFDHDILVEMDKLDSFLIDEYGIEQLISPSMMVKKMNYDIHHSHPNNFSIPENGELRTIVNVTKSKKFEDQLRVYIDKKQGLARISGRLPDMGSDYFNEKNKDLELFFNTSGLTDSFDYKITGSASLIDLSSSLLASNLLIGLLVAFGLIAIIAGATFKSIRLVFVLLFVNIVPLIGIAGIMGFMGLDLKISTSVIFTIAFGIAIDDSIHFMSKFKLEYANGKTVLYALKRTYSSTGRAIVLTTIILIGGFITLVFSDFMGTYYIGVLVSGTLVIALLVDLFLLPWLLLFAFGNKKAKKNNSL